MMALANSLRRIWSAKNRVPRLTGWGMSGPRKPGTENIASWVNESLRHLVAAAYQTAPTVIVATLNIFR
jgi:hypothetical protein